MRKILSFLFIATIGIGHAQTIAPCVAAENICGQNGTSFGLNQSSSPTGLPSGLNVSNPTGGSSIPPGAGSGCLFSNGTYPNWFVINVGTSGNLEFTIGQAGGSGFFDWAMWPYNTSDPTGSCNAIFNNQQAPAACNWNASSGGFTGMWNGGVPVGGNAGNFVPSIPVVAGQAYILLFSNYSGASGSSNLSFPSNPGSAGISCSPGTPDQTICLGQSATVNIMAPQPITSANWLVTNGVSNTSGFSNVIVSPTVTTQYVVAVNMSGTIVNDTFNITVIPPPAPNAGPDQTVCLGTSILLNANAPTAPNTATWNVIVPPGMVPAATASFSPNFSSPTPTVTVNQPGVYKFIWRHNSTLCGVVRDTVVVTVSELQVSAAPTHPSCGGYSDGAITITSAGATEYSFDGGTTWQTSNTLAGFAANTYNVCARNALGCSKCTTVTLIDPTPVVVSVSNDTLICQNGTASLLASATGGTSYTYHWNHTPSLLPNQSVSPLVNTYYPVVAENELGCLSQPDSIHVTIRPGLSGTLSPIDQSVCPGYPGTISVNSITGGISTPYNFVWSTGVTNSGSTSSITESPMTTTTYTVTIDDACETTPLVLQTQIITYPLPVPLIAVDEPIKCEPASFTLTNMTDPTMSANIIWNISDGQQFIDQNTIVPADLWAGNYDVQLIVTSPNGCIDSTTFNSFLTVQSKPEADFNWSPDPVTMFNTEVFFQNLSTGADTYTWTFQSGYPSTSTNENQTVFFPDGVTGYYDVSLVAMSYLGCSDTITKTVPVMPEVILYAPNSFTPDGDEFNQAWFVHIIGIDPQDFELLVYNRWGQIVWESLDPKGVWDGTYNGEIIPPGTYTWTIRTKDMLNDKKYEWQGTVNVIR
ncbi:MAG: gliding motility-associated C-terminal domain-containing protein [Fluviicola sp.]|nr:gliding motility-associated C-terminal domain-containing protein [Fluviicola sp.]